MNLTQLIETNKAEFYQALAKVMAVKSVKGPKASQAPFGIGPKEALLTVLEIAKSYGFETKMIADAVGYAQLGQGSEYIGVVGHLDVVAAGGKWTYPPFQLTNKNGTFYGRGILDNKGPIMACLFALKLLKEQHLPLKRPIRIIFGTDEESGSHDLPLYLKQEAPPLFGFTPDCKYPVVYGERGIVHYAITMPFSQTQLQRLGEIIGDQASDHVPDLLRTTVDEKVIEVAGKRAPSNAPELGINAIPLLANKLGSLLPEQLGEYFSWLADMFDEQHHGQRLGLDFSDEESGRLLLTPYRLVKESNGITVKLAIRYPISVNEEQLTTTIKKNWLPNSQLQVTRRLKSSYFPKTDAHVKQLTTVYEQVMGGVAEPVTTTGATYARFMPNLVAFGPSFPGQKGIAHKEDEFMTEVDLLKNLEIYLRALTVLAC